jgi:hypothetical protein
MITRLQGIEHTFVKDDQAIAITSLALDRLGVWCGLTGGRHCLVRFDLKSKQFEPAVDVFPWVDDCSQVVLRKIHNALGCLSDGRLVFGEGILYTWDGIPFELGDDRNTNHMFERRRQCGAPKLQMERLGPSNLELFDMRWMSGGKIQIYDPRTKTIEPAGQIQPFNYVQSMVVDSRNDRAYGHTLGDCHFFVVDLKRKTVEDHGRISTFAFHNLVVAPDGVVYGAWIDFDLENKLRVLRFDPRKGYLERLKAVYLDDPGPRVQGNRGIDQWLVHSSGDLYMGMAGNGFLYRFEVARLRLHEIGRIGIGGRVTSMVEDEEGCILFSAGFPVMNVGRYDPKRGLVEDFGPVTDRYSKIYFHGAVYRDRTLYLAETDSGVASLWEVPIPDRSSVSSTPRSPGSKGDGRRSSGTVE